MARARTPLGALPEGVLIAAYGPNQPGLWFSDGTESGTRPVGNVSTVVEMNGGVLGGRVFFAGQDLEHGGELWVSDGIDAGTLLVKDIYPGPGYSGIYTFAESQGRLYFAAYDGEEPTVSGRPTAPRRARSGSRVFPTPDTASSARAVSSTSRRTTGSGGPTARRPARS